MARTGWTLSALVLLFLAFDITIKFLRLPVVVETTVQLGWPASSIVPLALVLALGTILYAIPNTCVLGAILLTGYLGGAVATHARLGSPLLSPYAVRRLSRLSCCGQDSTCATGGFEI